MSSAGGNSTPSAPVGVEGALEERSASPMTSPPEAGGSQSQPVDYSQVEVLLQGTISGDFKALQKAAAAIKAFLTGAGDATLVEKLMRTEQFLPFLVNCLKAKSDGSSVHLEATWIMAAILKEKKSFVREISDVGTLPLLVKLLNSPDPAVLEQVTFILGIISQNRGIRDTTFTTKVQKDLFLALAKILKRKNPGPSEQLLKHVTDISVNILLGDRIKCIDSGALANLALPPSTVMRQALPVISLLLDHRNPNIEPDLLQLLCVSAVAFDDIASFVTNGLCTKLASYLGHSEKEVLIGTATIFGCIAMKGHKELLKFLKAFKGTDGLGQYWRCMTSDLLPNDAEDNERLLVPLLEFVNGVGGLVFNDSEKLTGTMAVIDSGLAHAFAQCLKSDCSSKFQLLSMNILSMLSSDLPDSRKGAFIEMDILPHAVEYLKSSDLCALASAPSVIAMLVDDCPQLRDQAISLGVVPILLGIVGKQEYLSQVAIMYNSMRALECLLQVKIKVPLETFKDLPGVLIKFFKAICMTTEDLMVTSVGCLKEFIEYGTEGIDLIFETPHLPRKMTAYLYSKMPELQLKGAETLLRLCELGNSQHRCKMMELGVLEHFKDLLLAQNPKTRKVALECLPLLMKEEMTSMDRLAIERLKPIVSNEMSKRNAETIGPARSVFNKMQAV